MIALLAGVPELPVGLFAKKRFEVAFQRRAIIAPPFFGVVVGLVSIRRLRHPRTPLALLAAVAVRCTTTDCWELTSCLGHRASAGRRETEAVAGSVFGRVAHSPRAGARRGTASGKLYGGKASVRRARRGTPRNGAGVSHRTHSTEEEGLWG